ncbi:efflux RND transporter permease subunit [Natronospirillum operosum]|uniref:Efflux RND transporter permease subunit n=1 Tax=Natronospirillum operosum TaxID=2759953 RepID=A0A4Z0W9R4_9GAMM|nr:efflux RND transporter permease subunit [Natronospirillum operosum]TGG95359.1 efflux RND transporter permease subunit [Natronospirillum operosum]
MTSVLAAFARHRVAPNVLMFVVILLGLWALERLNTQFLPDFELSIIQVSTDWPGVSAEEVQDSLTIPLENALAGNADIDTLESSSFEGGMTMDIALREGVADPDRTLRDIERAFAGVDLPAGADDPQVTPFVFFERVADVLLHGDLTFEEMRYWARSAERSLSNAGIAQIEVAGVPEREWQIGVPPQQWLATGLSLRDLADRLADANVNAPAGLSGERVLASQWQLRNREVDALGLGQQTLPIAGEPGFMALGDLGDITRVYVDDDVRLFYQEQPAVRLTLSRARGENTLDVAATLQDWRQDFEPGLPAGIALHLFNEDWRFVQSRISIILESGLGGMVLVLLVLFIFLNHRVAFWVALGIPVSFLATLVLMELTGNSINLISLFGFLVALGIIVDDAIVVGEQTYAEVERGEDPQDAAVAAARKMLPAVLASSVTTIAAFLPLLLVTGQAGTFTISVPLVVIFAILASLIECFLILPGHLAHSLRSRAGGAQRVRALRRGFERGFDWVRQVPFRTLVRFAVDNRLTTYSVALVSLLLAVVLVISGRVAFVFFPDIQQEQVTLKVDFAPGTSVERVDGFLRDMESALLEIDRQYPFPVVDTLVRELNRGAREQGALFVTFDGATDRPVSNAQILRAWREAVTAPPGIIALRFEQPSQGPSTNEVSVRLRGDDTNELKAASEWLQSELRGFGGLRDIRDNLPLGSEQLALRLNPEALALGLSTRQLGDQLADLTRGRTAQIIPQDDEDLRLRVVLPGRDTATWADLQNIPVLLPDGDWQPLSALVTVEFTRATDRFNRINRELAAEVHAELGADGLTLNDVNSWLRTDILEQLEDRFAVFASLEGDQAGQAQFLQDVQFGAVLALILIFGALAWVFESWVWPFAVLAAIPFALTGAIGGHWLMGLELSALSIYGLFGLSGIVINNGIVLVIFYRDLRATGLAVREAVVEAAVQRFRAVLLTSLTTIAGLSFLLTETSFDAQFLIPLAAGIVFGLAFGTLIMLVLVPALLTSIELGRQRMDRWRGRPLEGTMQG